MVTSDRTKWFAGGGIAAYFDLTREMALVPARSGDDVFGPERSMSAKATSDRLLGASNIERRRTLS
jgi:hypothetical protein